jgi:hypothetical protein
MYTDKDQASRIAGQVLGAAEAKRAADRTRVSRWSGVAQRLHTSFATLVASGLGFAISLQFSSSIAWRIAFIAAAGLLGGIFWSPSRAPRWLGRWRL